MRFLFIIIAVFQPALLLARQIDGDSEDSVYSDYEFTDYRRMEILAGGSVNWFGGAAGDHLGIGGGLKADVLWSVTESSGIGLAIGMYFNPLKKEYNLSTTGKQEDVIPTIFTGVALNNRILKTGNGELTAQLELNILFQNIVAPSTDTSNDNVQFVGFSPGIFFHYLMEAGKPKSGYPVKQRYVNLYFGIRPMLINDNAQASGTMFELGVAFRSRNYSNQ